LSRPRPPQTVVSRPGCAPIARQHPSYCSRPRCNDIGMLQETAIFLY